MKKWLVVLKKAAKDWSEDNASRLAASLAFYTLLSIAPLVVLAISIAGLIFGDDAARGHLSHEMSAMVGTKAADAIEAIIKSARAPESGVIGTIVGIVVLLFGASGVFGELHTALDTLWEVKPRKGGGVIGVIKDRFLSFTMVLGVAFLLMVSLILSTVLSAIGHFLEGWLPGGEVIWQIANFFIQLAVISTLFALIFKYVPDVKVRWREVMIGGAVTALLFSLGKLGLALYLGKSTMSSSFGAAGSLVVLVVWVYYSAQILFFGAEFTQAYANHFGVPIRPNHRAVSLSECEAEEVVGPKTTGPHRPLASSH